MNWYSARCLFVHEYVEGFTHNVYEERVVLLRADSEQDALNKGEADAREYALSNPHTLFTGEIDVFILMDEVVVDKSELYSCMNESTLDKDAYIKRFYNRGRYIGQTD